MSVWGGHFCPLPLETSSKSKSKAADKIVRPHELEADHHGLRLEPNFPEFFDALLDLAF